MSQTSLAPVSSNYQVIFDDALEAYRKRTKEDLRSHPLLTKLESCQSPDAILAVLREQLPALDQSGECIDRLTKLLDPTVKVLSAFSTTIGGAVSHAYPPAGVIFTGISTLFSAVIAVGASQDTLVELFERIQGFFVRLETYTEVPPTAGMTDIIVRIMAEVLSVLAIAKADVKPSTPKRLFKKLLGRTDIEKSLRTLDNLFQEEARMASASVMRATEGVNSRVKCVVREVQCVGENVLGVDERVKGVDDRIGGVDDRVKDVDCKVKGIEDKVKDVADGVKGVGDRVIDEVEKFRRQIANDFGNLSRSQLRQDIRNWLFPPDPSINFNAASNARHEGTSLWFTQGDAFKDWKASGSLFWIYGKPGSGKSTLTSAIIQDIKASSSTGLAYMAYFFFDFMDTGKQDARALLSSFLVQLSNQSDSLCDVLLAFYSVHNRGAQKPSERELTQCLEDMLKVSRQVPIYFVVDALDECPHTTGLPSSRDQVLALVKKLTELNLSNLRLLITSRPEIDIRVSLEPLTSNRMSLHDECGQRNDIVEFIGSVVHSDKSMRRWRDEDKRLVTHTLSDKADGMFRWVFCQLETLRHCIPPNVRPTLAALPETLDKTYERILREIPKPNRELAHRLLQCLTVAVRPLGAKELAEVLAIDFSAEGGIPKLNEDLRWQDQEQDVLSVCSNLITIVNIGRGHRVVQFSHFSVKEFLTSDRLASPRPDSLHYHHIRTVHAHMIMAQACLGVLLRLDDQMNNASLQSYPLAGYAAEHFSHHATFDTVMLHIRAGVDHVLDTDKPHFGALLWIRELSLLRTKHPKRPEGSPLYYVAEHGFCDLVHLLVLARPEDLHARGKYGTPLHVALQARHTDVSQLLLEHCDDVDIRGSEDRTPLHFAAHGGMVNVTRILIGRNADINSRDTNGQTPLHRILSAMRNTSSSTYIDTLRLLLGHHADVDAQDNEHLTPLHLASSYGCFKAVQILLEHGASVHVPSDIDETPLHRSLKGNYASLDSSLDITCTLLKHGASVDAQDKDRRTPLRLALRRKNLRAVQLLLGHGANVNLRNDDGETPLHQMSRGIHASSDTSLPNISLLFDHGADVNACNNEHWTPLHLASYYRRLNDTQLLLEHGANVRARNKSGETPLHILLTGILASTNISLDIIHRLLDHGADVDAQDKDGSTPLHLAARCRNLLAVQLLLELGANVYVQNNKGWTPLHQSLKVISPILFDTDLDIIRCLLNRGAVNEHDNRRWTALHLASYRGHREATLLLLEHGASVCVLNDSGETPLQLALGMDHPEIAQMFIGHG